MSSFHWLSLGRYQFISASMYFQHYPIPFAGLGVHSIYVRQQAIARLVAQGCSQAQAQVQVWRAWVRYWAPMFCSSSPVTY